MEANLAIVNLAVDCHFPRIETLLPNNYRIVYCAPPGVMDSLWVEDAKKHGADYVVSRDYDIEFWCGKNDLKSIWVSELESKSPNKLVKFLTKIIGK